MKVLVNPKWFFGGAVSILIGILSLIWTPYELAMEERLRMRPGLPPFDWWYDPPDVHRMKIYFFNITNEERFLSGKDPRLKVEEVGPIIFKEMFTYSDVVFNDNGTMSYTSRRELIYDPALNTIDLNSTVVVPNMGVLLGVSYFWRTNYLIRTALNYILDQIGKPIVKKTIYELLYNNTDPFLTLGYKLLHSLIVYDNAAIIPLMLSESTARVTVYTGTKFGHQKFFLIDKYNGSSYVPTSNTQCKEEIVNVSNSMTYSQMIPKTRKVKYFYDLACKITTFLYEDEVYSHGMKGYRFVVPKNEYNRTEPADKDCYKGRPTLLNGLTDMSLCWKDFPIVGSNPHFLYGDQKLFTYVDGMKPNATLHSSYSILEPETGITLQFITRVQMNLHIRPLEGFHKMFDKYSDMVIPYCIVEKRGDVPQFVVNFVRLVFILPVVGPMGSGVCLIFGVYCLWKSAKQFRGKRFFRNRIRRKMEDIVIAETEEFLTEDDQVSKYN